MRKLIIPIVVVSSVALSVDGVTGTRPAHADDVAQVHVDLGNRTGEFLGASSGVLYGLSDECAERQHARTTADAQHLPEAAGRRPAPER